MRPVGFVCAIGIVIAACGGAGGPEPSPWPEQTYGAIRVTLVRPSTGPYVAPTLPVGDTVLLRGSVFDPTALQVPLGATVTWTNRDGIAHTTTSGVPGFPDGKWDGQLYSGGSYSLAFTQAGTYPYYCRFHAAMYATIVVR